MRIRILAALGVFSALALPARAAEFVPGWSVETIWDSNVLRTSEDEQADFSIRTGPNLQVQERQGDLRYEISYRPRYEAFFETEGINEFDQFAYAKGRWRATPNAEFQLENSFAYTSSLAGVAETQVFGPSAITTVVPQRERVTLNTGSASYVHRLGPLWQFSTQYTNQLYEYANEFQPDSLSNGGNVQLTRSVSRRLTAGFGAGIQRQDFDAVSSDGEDTGTTFYRGFGTVSYSFSPTVWITANVGPAWSVPDSPPSEVGVNNYAVVRVQTKNGATPVGAVNPNTCRTTVNGFPAFQTSLLNGGCEAALINPVPPRPNDNPTFFPGPLTVKQVPFEGDIAEGALSYFGRISIQKSWNRWLASLSFDRNSSTSSGVGGSTILTSLTGNLEWKPTRYWTVNFNTIYTTQTSANEVREQLWLLQTAQIPPFIAPGYGVVVPDPVGIPFTVVSGDKIDNAIDIVTWRVELNAERRITRNLRVYGNASYWHQDSKGDLFVEHSQDVTRVLIGFDWTFDPIPL